MANEEKTLTKEQLRWRAYDSRPDVRARKILARRRHRIEHAAEISAQRKAKYRENPIPARERFKNYSAKAMASREMAVNVCPAFRFMLELKAMKSPDYMLHKGHYYSFVQRAISCPALTAADARKCPMFANPKVATDKMLSVCTMPDVFTINDAWAGVRKQARILREELSKGNTGK